MNVTAGWEGILDEGENILWQGRPDAAVVLTVTNVGVFLFGLAFAGFALFWMIMASQAGGGFWMFGLIHFFAGLGISFGAMFWNAWRRKHTWYTLTDRRAFIATDIPFKGRKLASYPITSDTVIEYKAGGLATLHFAREMRQGNKRNYHVPVGFERVADGDVVYRLMRDIQGRQTA